MDPLPESELDQNNSNQGDETVQMSVVSLPCNQLGTGRRSIESFETYHTDLMEKYNEKNKTCLSMASRVLGKMFDVRFLKDPIFLMKILSISIFCMGIMIPYTYLISLMENALDLDRSQFSSILFIMGLCNCLGRIAGGAISDLESVSPQVVVTVTTAIAAAAVVAMTFCNQLWMFMVAAGVFGFFIGPGLSLSSVILVELYGMENLTTTLGMWFFFEGVFTMPGTPIAGAIFNATKSYVAMFLFHCSDIGYFNCVEWRLLRIVFEELAQALNQARKYVLCDAFLHYAQRSIES